MRRRQLSTIAITAAAALALVAGCSGDDDDAAATTTTTTTSAPPTTGVAVDDPPPAATEIDCAAMKDPLFELAFSNPFLASLVSNDQFELIDDGTVDVDFDAVRDAVAALRPLDQVDPNPVGSVDEGLDRIDRAAALAAVAAEADDPSSSPAFDELQKVIADDAAFIGSLGPVNYAYGESGCF